MDVVVSYPGSGLYFWWQLGAASAPRDKMTPRARLVGASAGAAVAVLAACDIAPATAFGAATRIGREGRLWERPLGLAGVWGGIIRAWLDEILPSDAAARCEGRVSIAMLPMPSARRYMVSSFQSRQDLINATMTSLHVPLFMDGRVFSQFRGIRHIDSGFAASSLDVSLGHDYATTTVDFAHDPRLRHLKRNDLFQLHSEAKILEMIEYGREFGEETLAPNIGKGNLSKHATTIKQPMLHFLYQYKQQYHPFVGWILPIVLLCETFQLRVGQIFL